MNRCQVPACERAVKSKGLCPMHYRRQLRHGDPSVRYPTTAAADRFWGKVDRTGGPHACWPWTAGRTGPGYGQFNLGAGKFTTAHRWALAEKLGRPLIRGLEALHGCDNPPCCNPAHLREGTRQQNVDDAVGRGRHARGSGLPQAVLSEAQVPSIRERAAAGETVASLAREFGISASGMQGVISGRTWKHVDRPVPNNLSGSSQHEGV